MQTIVYVGSHLGSDSITEMRVQMFLRRVFFDPHEEQAQLV